MSRCMENQAESSASWCAADSSSVVVHASAASSVSADKSSKSASWEMIILDVDRKRVAHSSSLAQARTNARSSGAVLPACWALKLALSCCPIEKSIQPCATVQNSCAVWSDSRSDVLSASTNARSSTTGLPAIRRPIAATARRRFTTASNLFSLALAISSSKRASTSP